MIPSRPDAAPVSGWQRLGWLSLFGASCALAGGVHLLTGRGIPCPVLGLTGLQCPVCGATRMGVALLRGDLAAAWAYNPFMLLLGALLTLVWVWTGVRLLAGRSAALPGRFGRWVEARTPLQRLGLVVLPGLVWGVLRNLL
ncbi:hypothetical protein CGZ93_08920 [Enemella dayhoffiae]|uniref:DUF2752 domain-containing protein n=1 Tax=Enemella dayhoffiae TaxID=2016507 RepID=A0A255H610_9ACTN|nr:DUF2752 domain-containing protein [Enemella dayhoffiae]OYO22034.1 hypothetical protein CGZ93_08920 [Enemella dayhoffiae]